MCPSGFAEPFYVEALQGAGGKRSLGPTPSFPLPHAACRPIESPHLLEASLDAAVFAGNHLAVPVLGGPTGEAQVGVALSHCQVAGTLLGVALGLTATAREAILTWGGGGAQGGLGTGAGQCWGSGLPRGSARKSM